MSKQGGREWRGRGEPEAPGKLFLWPFVPALESPCTRPHSAMLTSPRPTSRPGRSESGPQGFASGWAWPGHRCPLPCLCPGHRGGGDLGSPWKQSLLLAPPLRPSASPARDSSGLWQPWVRGPVWGFRGPGCPPPSANVPPARNGAPGVRQPLRHPTASRPGLLYQAPATCPDYL